MVFLVILSASLTCGMREGGSCGRKSVRGVGSCGMMVVRGCTWEDVFARHIYRERYEMYVYIKMQCSMSRDSNGLITR